MTTHADLLRDKLSRREATVAVLGMGYVGLPLAMAAHDAGFAVLGFDVDAEKVEKLNRGEGYIQHIRPGKVAEMAASGRFRATADETGLAQADVLVICVPTPLTKHREPDMRFVDATTEIVARVLRPGQLVVLESTTYPGTTDERMKPVLEARGLACGTDFFLAFSPEREDPGNKDFGTTNTPKVVGGVDPISGDLAEAFYGAVVQKVVRVRDARTAEAAKLTENVFRAVNIALVNELKMIYDKMGIDVWDVLDAASTKPFGFMRFNPGPGWGGHCLAGGEFVRIRGLGLDGPYRLSDLFERFRGTNPLLATPSGLYLRVPGLEALSVDEGGRVAWKPVSILYKGEYDGPAVVVRTEDNRTLRVTDRHPMLVQSGRGFVPLLARDLRKGMVLPVTADRGPFQRASYADLVEAVPAEDRRKVFVRVEGVPWKTHEASLKRCFGWTIRDSVRSDALRLDRFLEIEKELRIPRARLRLLTGRGRARREWPSRVRITPGFCRLLGYYLSEGCITRDRNAARVRWTFNRDETEAVEDVRRLLGEAGFSSSVYQDRTWNSTTIKASSLLLADLLEYHWKTGTRSEEMRVPDFCFALSRRHRMALLSGLLRGDGEVYVRTGPRSYRKKGRSYTHHDTSAAVGFFSSSPALLEQVTLLLQDLGLRPRRHASKPRLLIQGAAALETLRPLLCDAKRRRLEEGARARRRSPQTQADRCWANPSLATVPVRGVRKTRLREPVYSLEVEGTHTFTASTGLAVHNCIPLDPFYLTWKAREYGLTSDFIEHAGKINRRMPEYVVEKLTLALNERGKAVKGAKILVLGVAYKKDIDDPRESPAFEILDLLLKLGADVSYHDPHIPELPRMREWPHLPRLRSLPLTAETLGGHDAALLVTDHTAVDYEAVRRHAPLVVDTRGKLRGLDGKVVKA